MATAEQLSFSQFIDLLLARLYEAQRDNREGMIDLNDIALDLKESVPEDWVVDAAKIMQSRGLADCIISFGACRARLTGLGMIFVEEGRGSGIINRYRQEPAQYFNHIHVSGSGTHQVVVGNHQSGINQTLAVEFDHRQVLALVDKIQEGIRKDSSLAADERQEIENDIESLRHQVKKRVPNTAALAAILEPLGRIASVAGQVVMLINLLNSSR